MNEYDPLRTSELLDAVTTPRAAEADSAFRGEEKRKRGIRAVRSTVKAYLKDRRLFSPFLGAGFDVGLGCILTRVG